MTKEKINNNKSKFRKLFMKIAKFLNQALVLIKQ